MTAVKLEVKLTTSDFMLNFMRSLCLEHGSVYFQLFLHAAGRYFRPPLLFSSSYDQDINVLLQQIYSLDSWIVEIRTDTCLTF